MKRKISEEKLQARIEKEKLYQESISANGLKCSKCDKIKDSNNFYSYKRNAAIGKVERYSCICKECTSVERKNNYLENTDRIKSNVKNWRVRNPNRAN